MKAAQVVITPKPMPQAKATTERASKDVPKAFQDNTRTRAEDHNLGVSKKPKLYHLKAGPGPTPPVININFFGGMSSGSGASSSSGAWACIILCFFLESQCSRCLFIFYFLIPADGVSGLMRLLATLLGSGGAYECTARSYTQSLGFNVHSEPWSKCHGLPQSTLQTLHTTVNNGKQLMSRFKFHEMLLFAVFS